MPFFQFDLDSSSRGRLLGDTVATEEVEEDMQEEGRLQQEDGRLLIDGLRVPLLSDSIAAKSVGSSLDVTDTGKTSRSYINEGWNFSRVVV